MDRPRPQVWVAAQPRKRTQPRVPKGLAVGFVLAGLATVGASTTNWHRHAVSEASGAVASLTGSVAGVAAARSQVVALEGWDLPVTRNMQVEAWIAYLAGRRHKKMQEWLEQSGRYVPMMQEKLRARGMPEDLVYLALIESGFSPNAYSKARAAGLWQFIAETGRLHGLEVSEYVDERRDPLKATDAALTFLTELHGQFGSWYLAAAAYNSGPNRVQRILNEHANGAKGDEELYWQISDYLPQETRDYVPLMLAAGFIAKDPGAYGFTNLNYAEPVETAPVIVPGGVSLATVAEAAGSELSEIRDLNPQLVRSMTPPGRLIEVRVPQMHTAAFTQNFARVSAKAKRVVLAAAPKASTRATSKASARTVAHHVVRRGDTLTSIAKRYKVTVVALRAANSGVKASSLRPGKVLRVPKSV